MEHIKKELEKTMVKIKANEKLLADYLVSLAGHYRRQGKSEKEIKELIKRSTDYWEVSLKFFRGTGESEKQIKKRIDNFILPGQGKNPSGIGNNKKPIQEILAESSKVKTKPVKAELVKVKRKDIFAELERKNVTFLETNIVRLPLCKPTKIASKTGISYSGIDKKGLPFLWKVRPSVEYGDPTTFEQDVLFGLFTMVTNKKFESEGTIEKRTYFTTKHLCVDIMKKLKGDNLKRTEEALKNLRTIIIETKNILCTKDKKYIIDDAFQLLKATLVEEIDPNSTGDEVNRKLNYVEINELFLHNLSLNFAYKYNPDYYYSLKKYLAKKLYILFNYDFTSSKGAPLHFLYTTLCEQIPLERKNILWDIEYQTNPGLEELKATKYIKKYKWSTVNKKQKIFKLDVWAGERFSTEYRQNKEKKKLIIKSGF
jgi:hypothetical protein